MRKKKEEPIVIDPEEPLYRCYDCIHWHMIDDGVESGIHDFSSGTCDLNGYAKCPTLFSCKGWENAKGQRKI